MNRKCNIVNGFSGPLIAIFFVLLCVSPLACLGGDKQLSLSKPKFPQENNLTEIKKEETENSESETDKTTYTISTVNRLEVHINTTADKVWPVVIDKKRWMADVEEEVLISGKRNQAGAVYRVATSVGNQRMDRIEEVLKSIEPKQYVLKATPVVGDNFVTFIDYNLKNTKDGCDLRLNIFMHYKLKLNEKLVREDLQRMSENCKKLIQKKIEKDHRRLKDIVEAM